MEEKSQQTRRNYYLELNSYYGVMTGYCPSFLLKTDEGKTVGSCVKGANVLSQLGWTLVSTMLASNHYIREEAWVFTKIASSEEEAYAGIRGCFTEKTWEKRLMNVPPNCPEERIIRERNFIIGGFNRIDLNDYNSATKGWGEIDDVDELNKRITKVLEDNNIYYHPIFGWIKMINN